ncbi:2-amino-4-hydroxy-6-hydroxymethyldihydropteridine diphosphokinase [Paeniclostridium hominis]|uniref:2-amino-4-hydroxy-6-hydroxymethyldihydropteridine diphosphokinase n=1 Tax=Paeniclostridium hominis TaxID=2764329 RepID=A0ABR7K163_9FIRM|nr:MULTISPECIES: 2-amino-4-hydroxy-6-hydroxymethyldihydropteridine diphosphokinase [Paeniclostridium]MBC6002827.1 2-amino-4-hydroxy-6-hydroxymethyldihydropteridine diphosphokinase [Paeniclostridium hominis]MBC8630338.1 2-amino-4-hydroxy-6-hydroxymethyldihydropteridine diphosphokinase [[Eubacterium] tenue]
MNKSYLGLGTNIGDRLNYLNQALNILNSHSNIKISKKSKLYETKAWGYTEQADFLNMCVEIETDLNPKDLLHVCQDVEKKLNRERKIRWGPRTIDVDILFFNDIILQEENLEIPHPRIKERAFVLIPLIDLNDKLKIDNVSINEYLKSLTTEEREEVKEFIGNEKKLI